MNWSFGDGTSATGQNVYHAYTAPGTYTVCVSEMDFMGSIVCTYCQNITIGGGPSPSCNFTVNNSPANPTIYGFTIPQAQGVAYFWNLGNGQTQTGNNVAVNYAPGTYTICLTANDGNTSNTCCTTIVVTGAANCSFNYFPDSANANLYYFNALPSQAGSNIIWHFGDSTTSTGQNVGHTYPGPGSYYACMTEIDPATGATLCSYCTTITVSSNGNCSFSVTSSPGNPSVVTFTGNSLIGTSFFWDFGDNSTGVGQNITHTYASPGVYNVCLSIGVGGVITCTYCQTITIPGNSWCQAAFTSVSLGLNAYFIDQSSIIPITMPPVPPPVNYSWSFGDGSSSTLQFPNHQYAAPGSYMVCLTASTVGCTSTFCDTIVIDTVINNPVTCNAFFVFTQTSPYNVVGVNLSSGINLAFNWDFGDGSTANTPYPTHQYNGTGSYLVCLTVSDANGCSSTYCDTLTVDSLGNVVYRGATSSGFTLNIVAPNVLGVEDNQPAIGSLYPVPASSELNIRFSDKVKEEVTYNVLSIDGRRIMNGQLNGTTATLNIESLQQGIYLLEVITSDGQRDSQYFVKQ
jgi:PKD repeat protein